MSRTEISREVYEELKGTPGIKLEMEFKYYLSVVNTHAPPEAECGWITGMYKGRAYRSKASLVRLTSEWEARLLTIENQSPGLFNDAMEIATFIDAQDTRLESRDVTRHFESVDLEKWSGGHGSKTLTRMIELGIIEFKNP